jgi:hypothetical protein
MRLKSGSDKGAKVSNLSGNQPAHETACDGQQKAKTKPGHHRQRRIALRNPNGQQKVTGG